ncbi:hypothetical protein [Agathobacter ruminis]|uniref:Flagellar hook-associated protein 2 C-terminal domain-containing protein n=1 Tax=Agathobacter ruminis TaxID=1712665 RepID=A0A2G3E4W0_9FIRM|nr:hypothetical protein [Agathobacter ruminis]MDC7301247.1 hypothetical protein [Agathobacter ruminis]PHU38113.1 hypothetical protein CSX02_04350 [Agathobacter ruminis]
MAATKVSTGVTLPSDYYLRNYYQANTAATKASRRKNYSTLELNYEDSRALRRASSRITHSNYAEDANVEGLANSVKAYVDTYNNTLTSASKNPDNRRYAKQLKDLSEKYKEDLSKIGISIEDDGSLNLNETYIKTVDAKEIGKLFSKESEFTKMAGTISKRMNQATRDTIYANMTGSGQTINIVL